MSADPQPSTGRTPPGPAESEPAESEPAGTEPADARRAQARAKRALRRAELLAKVREANRQSRTGPDSPALGPPG